MGGQGLEHPRSASDLEDTGACTQHTDRARRPAVRPHSDILTSSGLAQITNFRLAGTMHFEQRPPSPGRHSTASHELMGYYLTKARASPTRPCSYGPPATSRRQHLGYGGG